MNVYWIRRHFHFLLTNLILCMSFDLSKSFWYILSSWHHLTCSAKNSMHFPFPKRETLIFWWNKNDNSMWMTNCSYFPWTLKKHYRAFPFDETNVLDIDWQTSWLCFLFHLVYVQFTFTKITSEVLFVNCLMIFLPSCS